MTLPPSDDFAFVYGTWTVRNRKLRDVTDPACTDWVEFDATSEVSPLLGGFGHVDRMFVPDPPDGPAFEGFTLRLYDPVEGTWRIWWSSTRAPGRLDVPVVGRFSGGRGVFEADDVLAGRAVRLRFVWEPDQDRPVWTQSFSYDRGGTWATNWTMRFERTG